MIISKINFSPYKVPFKVPFKTAYGNFEFREGIIIELQTEKHSGYGETAPLIHFSNETLIEARNSLEGFALAISEINENQTLEDLLLLAEAQSFECPSTLFGLETAIYDLFSKNNQIPFWRNFSNETIECISINGLEKDIKTDIDYSVYKIKLTNSNIFKVKDKIENIVTLLEDNYSLRIDANGSLDLPRAIRLCKELEKFNIEYIEQPLAKNELEDLSELRMHTEIPIAVDESLTDLNSAIEIIENQSADIFIIKPMVSGSLKETIKIIELGKANGIESVITTTLGTEIERQACIQLAFAGKITLSCGFSTPSLMKENVINNYIPTANIFKPVHIGLNLIPTKIPFL